MNATDLSEHAMYRLALYGREVHPDGLESLVAGLPASPYPRTLNLTLRLGRRRGQSLGAARPHPEGLDKTHGLARCRPHCASTARLSQCMAPMDVLLLLQHVAYLCMACLLCDTTDIWDTETIGSFLYATPLEMLPFIRKPAPKLYVSHDAGTTTYQGQPALP